MKIKTEKLLIVLIALLLALSIMYVLCAFYFLSFNPANWSENGRFTMLYVGSMCGLFWGFTNAYFDEF